MQIDKSLNDFLTYSEIYGGDKAVTSVLESWEKDEKGFMYDIICQNFLVGISRSMTKAEYAAENFILEESRKECRIGGYRI